jgi:HSP20 family protein
MTSHGAMQEKEARSNRGQLDVTRGGYFTPRVDILETADELTLLADMPGVKPEDADIRFENGELTVHGRCAARLDGVQPLLAEYGVGNYYRAFTITLDVDADKISAEMKQGVLTVRLPKAEKVKPRKIAVKGE